MIIVAPWFVSNLTLHNDLNIPCVYDEITFHANTYKLRTIGHSYRLISELCKILGFHGGDYKEWCLLGCHAM
jgi:hypothetical protein